MLSKKSNNFNGLVPLKNEPFKKTPSRVKIFRKAVYVLRCRQGKQFVFLSFAMRVCTFIWFVWHSPCCLHGAIFCNHRGSQNTVAFNVAIQTFHMLTFTHTVTFLLCRGPEATRMSLIQYTHSQDQVGRLVGGTTVKTRCFFQKNGKVVAQGLHRSHIKCQMTMMRSPVSVCTLYYSANEGRSLRKTAKTFRLPRQVCEAITLYFVPVVQNRRTCCFCILLTALDSIIHILWG